MAGKKNWALKSNKTCVLYVNKKYYLLARLYIKYKKQARLKDHERHVHQQSGVRLFFTPQNISVPCITHHDDQSRDVALRGKFLPKKSFFLFKQKRNIISYFRLF